MKIIVLMDKKRSIFEVNPNILVKNSYSFPSIFILNDFLLI
ncbi:hypothetical protein C427_4018 [Paraglaciecola psychrophila 170]|uniref:Uncharacterized protein n=1 Tax=Paraglaciecola psychrophila 170 TaxID=1129794 RepID=K7A4E7_9ALTE|nr:hypothetical protein C427_4018 [Paraglaciecola psychrophila 170]GAC35738.1 hypothetical protein GPSY_0093 [Paraglaciecola psychrophila 170]